jgi:hypothetical protein
MYFRRACSFKERENDAMEVAPERRLPAGRVAHGVLEELIDDVLEVGAQLRLVRTRVDSGGDVGEERHLGAELRHGNQPRTQRRLHAAPKEPVVFLGVRVERARRSAARFVPPGAAIGAGYKHQRRGVLIVDVVESLTVAVRLLGAEKRIANHPRVPVQPGVLRPGVVDLTKT